MAFTAARLTRYERTTNAAGTQILRIFAAGTISDDTQDSEEPTEYWIVGDEMAHVGQPDPVNYPLPGNRNAAGVFDPHVLKVREILAREARRSHTAWLARVTAESATKLVERSAAAIAATPPITLAELPPPDPVAV